MTRPKAALPADDLAGLEALARAARFPRLMLRPGVYVNPGADAWQRFLTNGSERDHRAALEAFGTLALRGVG